VRGGVALYVANREMGTILRCEGRNALRDVILGNVNGKNR
jgi:hypothetical protein